MAKKANTTKPRAPRKAAPKDGISNSKALTPTVDNGFGEAIGFNTTGLPILSPGGTQQLSQTTTLFQNLRYYLLSNFRQILAQAYAELGLVSTVVDIPVDDALRGGIIIKSKTLDEDDLEQLALHIKRRNVLTELGTAAKWMRLYGGGALILMTDQDPMRPLDISKISEKSNVQWVAADLWELYGEQANTDGDGSPFAMYDFEYYSYYGHRLHKSRVLRLVGRTAPSFVRPRLRGWGLSVLETLVRPFNQYMKTADLTFEVLDEFKVDVFKIKNLVNTLATKAGTESVQRRVAMANWQKNYQNALTMDSEDDFDHKQISFTGLAEISEGNRMQLASDTRMPITKLFGTSASKGFQTDQNDMENYNAMVEGDVRHKLESPTRTIVEVSCQELFGSIPDDLSIEFPPLRELTAVEEDTIKTGKFTRAIQAKTAGEITTKEFRDAANKGDLLDIELSNQGDELDPNDPEIDDVLEGVAADEARADAQAERDNPPEKKAKKDNALSIGAPLPESLPYLHAAFLAEGGSGKYEPARVKAIVEIQEFSNQDFWKRAKEVSEAVFNCVKWPFVIWYVERHGRKL